MENLENENVETSSNASEEEKAKSVEEFPYWEGKKYAFFNHSECEFFPCHKTKKPEEFNCLFCYCPLYALGDKCGGNFKFSDDGIKDCSNCMIPHTKSKYGYIMSKFSEIVEITKRNRD
ncbi:MAG: cysteine-rich small domain-containing protein [Clostridiales bacterium]|jgi:hypothetical protein|nr:cysteine-rich small domain-containing protein [Clostridiales bacterium]